jgi:UDP-N-acetylmuramate--alanine ligase
MPSVTEQNLSQYKNLHFVGVGGSGMFPIAQILLAQGHHISGSDNNPGETIDQECAMGMDVHIGHCAQNIEGADAVVYSAAIMADNVELAAARERGIPLIERSEMLGLLSRRYSDCVCISGTHGKTTTTAMVTHILLEAGFDPSAVIGGKLRAIGGSGRVGSGDAMVIEACEFVDTFLRLSPDVAVILNIDADHLDYFKTVENIILSFSKFAKSATRAVVYNADDENTRKAVSELSNGLDSFGYRETCDYYPKNIVWRDGSHGTFDLMHKGNLLCPIELNVPGEHNVLNAVAACAAAAAAGAGKDALRTGIAAFGGVHRRFEILGVREGVTIADDYAHHPAELRVTLKTAKSLGYENVWAVFQPYTFSRTVLLLEDFAEALTIADRVVLSAIMGGRERNTWGNTSAEVGQKLPGCVCLATFEEIADYVMQNAGPGDLVITLGCGDVYKCANLMMKTNKKMSKAVTAE